MFPMARSRVDTLALKSRLSEVLSPEDGAEYWRTWGELLTGKITRDEWSLSTRDILVGEAARLHNQLILAVLYNTTRSAVAPPATSRHAGWSKRRRDADDEASQLALSLDPREAKKRRVKELVHSLGKKERMRIKNLALLSQPVHRGEMLQRSFGLGEGVLSHATFADKGLSSEFKRCQAAQICVESLALPAPDTLKDRMSCGAFTASLSGGVEPAAAVLLGSALEVHLRNLVAGALGVMRGRRRLDPRPPVAASPERVVDAPASKAVPQKNTGSNCITMLDMATILELKPQLLVNSHVGAVEQHLSAYDWALPRSESDDEILPLGSKATSQPANGSPPKAKASINGKADRPTKVVSKDTSPPKVSSAQKVKSMAGQGILEKPPIPRHSPQAGSAAATKMSTRSVAA